MKIKGYQSHKLATRIALLARREANALDELISDEESLSDVVDMLTGGELDATQMDMMTRSVQEQLELWVMESTEKDSRIRQAMGVLSEI